MKDVITKDLQLLFGDCLERMKEIPDGSIDLILTDPPFNTTSISWDKMIPIEPMWNELKRITKSNSAILLFGIEPFSSKIRMSNLDMYRYDWTWCKSRASGFAHAKNMPLKNVENIMVFSNGAVGHKSQCKNRLEYYPQGLIYSPKVMKNTKVRSGDESAFGKRPSHKDEYIQEWTNYPTQVLNFESVTKAVHPTQKPVPLLEYLINTYTIENATVLDFTAGSFSTGVACINTNRKFIGIERDDKYFNIGVNRMQEAIIKGEIK